MSLAERHASRRANPTAPGARPPAGRAARLAASAAAACEALESRAYRSATYTVGDLDTDGTPDLRVRGSSSKEHVVITEDPAAGTVTLWLDQDANNVKGGPDVVKTFAAPFGTFDVDLGSGDDTIEYRAVTSLDGADRSLLLTGGSGNDKVIVDTSGEDNGLFGSTFACAIDLGSGNDAATVLMGAVDQSRFTLRVDGSSGNDTIGVQMNGDIPDSLADLDVNLGTGKNRFDLVCAATISAGANVFLDVTGGNSASEYDAVTTKFINDVEDAKLVVTANLQAGNDTFRNAFDLESFDVAPLGLVRFNVNGGDGNDTLAVTRDGTVGPADVEEGAILDVRLIGGNGNDTLALDLGGNVENQRGLYLAGRIIATLDGQGGSDKVSADLSFSYDPGSYGDLSLSLLGGAGSDTMKLNLLDFIPLDPPEEEEFPAPDDGEEPEPDIPSPIGFTYGPAGAVVIDAQTGTDTTTLSGPVLDNVRVRNSEKVTVVPFTDVYVV